MVNRFFGEGAVEVDGVRYTLRCDFNAMCAFEDETGKEALATFEAFETGGVAVRDMRAMMWAFLQHHQPDMTLDLAGYILSQDMDALMQVIQAASPTQDEAAELGNGKTQKAKAARA